MACCVSVIAFVDNPTDRWDVQWHSTPSSPSLLKTKTKNKTHTQYPPPKPKQELPPTDLTAAPKVLEDAFAAIARGAGHGHSGRQQKVFEAAVALVVHVFQAYDLRWVGMRWLRLRLGLGVLDSGAVCVFFFFFFF